MVAIPRPDWSKVDKIALDALLHAYDCSQHWLKLFAVTVNDRSKLFGPEWESTNRRYELAKYVYERCYCACNGDERSAFHDIVSERFHPKGDPDHVTSRKSEER